MSSFTFTLPERENNKVAESKAKNEAGFGVKRRMPKAEVVYQATFKNMIPGDVAIALEKAVKATGKSYEEIMVVSTDRNGRDKEIPFVRHQMDDGTEIPVGTYRIQDIGDIEVGLDPYSPIPQIQVTGKLWNTKCKQAWLDLVDSVRKLASVDSIFRGKALLVENTQDFLIPRLMALDNEVDLFFNSSVEEQVDNCIMWPLMNREKARELGIRTRRGAILEGHYGAGKSLLLYRIAQVAKENGWGVLHISSGMIQSALLLAEILEPMCILVEDIDANTHGDRDRLNSVLNSISSVTTKSKGDFSMVVSTNFLERIDPALLRPERIDAIITVELPNEITMDTMIKHFCKGRLVGDVKQAAAYLMGTTPAIIAEVCQRALIDKERTGDPLTQEMLLKHAEKMARQRAMAQPELRKDNEATQLAQNLHRVVAYGYEG